MAIQVTGVLVDPMSQPLSNAVIRVTALDTTTVVAKASASVTVSLTGSYDFNLVEGKHSIEVLQKNTFHKVAYVDVTGISISPSTLEQLISIDGYCLVEAPTCPA